MRPNLLNAAISNAPVLLGGAFDALSAKIVEQLGFSGVWASSFSLSAAHGLPDIGLLGFSDYLHALAEMRIAVRVPIVADCEAGFGGPDQVHHVVKRLVLLGIDGISIEDSKMPRACSLYDLPARELASPGVQASKIRAACNAAKGPNSGSRLLVFARTEALIVHEGIEEALLRCRTYSDAGADALIVQTNEPSANRLFELSRNWDGSVPLVAIPTTYPETSVRTLVENNYRLIIYAHHAVRGAVKGMQLVLGKVLRDGRLPANDPNQATIEEISRLTGVGGAEE